MGRCSPRCPSTPTSRRDQHSVVGWQPPASPARELEKCARELACSGPILHNAHNLIFSVWRGTLRPNTWVLALLPMMTVLGLLATSAYVGAEPSRMDRSADGVVGV